MSHQYSDRDRKLGCDGIMTHQLRGVADRGNDGTETVSNQVDNVPTLKVVEESEDALALPQQTTVAVGMVLGKYELIDQLGHGGMGSVFLARHQFLGSKAAVKILPSDGGQHTSALERFRRESRAIAHLNHPNIVRAHDFGSFGDIHYLVMEHIEGTDLDRQVREYGPLHEEMAADYVRQACEGIACVHQAGLIHRDIKPANLLVDQHNVVKILDLGVVRVVDAHQTSLTLEFKEQLLGTIDFLAPEQGLDSHRVDPRSDIYSLGCTLYFLLAGRVPFPDGTLAQRMLKHQLYEPVDLLAQQPSLSVELVAICRVMMAKRPSERFQTALDAARALQDWLTTRRAAKLAETTSVPVSEETVAAWPVESGPIEDDSDDADVFEPSGIERHNQAARREARDDHDSRIGHGQGSVIEAMAERSARARLLVGSTWNDPASSAARVSRVVTQSRVLAAHARLDSPRSKKRRIAAACALCAVVTLSIGGMMVSGNRTASEISVPSESVHTLTFPNGKRMAQGTMVDGRKQGAWTYYNERGERVSSGSYEQDLKSGPWQNFINNGQLSSEGSFLNGKQHGPWVFRYDDGQKMRSGVFEDGLEEGRWLYWHANGRKEAEGDFHRGQRVGDWQYWSANGRLLQSRQ